MTNPAVLTREEVDRLRANPWKILYGKNPLFKENTMKQLYITLEQAKQLGSDLTEYAVMEDSSMRPLFKGFKIVFGDMLAEDMHPDQGFTMTPISEFTEIKEAG